MKSCALFIFAAFGLGAAQQSSTSTMSSWSSNGTSANVSPLSQLFGQMLRGQVYGLKKCKKPKDCGLGLRCDALLNLCVPFNTPILSDIEKSCSSNDTECSPMHSCQTGLCRFCGPKSCRSNMDCCAGSFAQPGKPGSFYECLNLEDLEKQSLARQLGRPVWQQVPGGKSPEDAIESEELLTLGVGAQGDPVMYGKRCWKRCSTDTDCHGGKAPAEVMNNIACCSGVCARRQSCVNVSQQAIQQQQQQQQMAAQHSQQLAAQQQQQQSAMNQQRGAGQQGGWGAHGHQLQQASVQPAQPGVWQPQPQVPMSWEQSQQPQSQIHNQGR